MEPTKRWQHRLGPAIGGLIDIDKNRGASLVRACGDGLGRAAAATPTTVLIGRLDPLLAIGLSACLRADRSVDVLGADIACHDVQTAVAQFSPQVIVLGDAAVETRPQPLGHARPFPGTIVLAHRPSPPYGSLILALGASCLASSAHPREIVAAIHFVSSGGRCFVGSDGRRVERTQCARDSLLTVRELAVLSLLIGARSYGEIALALGIKVETVRSHTVALRRKLEIGDRRELIGLRVPLLPGVAR